MRMSDGFAVGGDGLHPGVDHLDVDRGGAQVHTGETQPRVQLHQGGTAPAPGLGRTGFSDDVGRHQAVELSAQPRARGLQPVAKLCPRQGTLVAKQPQQSHLQRIGQLMRQAHQAVTLQNGSREAVLCVTEVTSFGRACL